MHKSLVELYLICGYEHDIVILFKEETLEVNTEHEYIAEYLKSGIMRSTAYLLVIEIPNEKYKSFCFGHSQNCIQSSMNAAQETEESNEMINMCVLG